MEKRSIFFFLFFLIPLISAFNFPFLNPAPQPQFNFPQNIMENIVGNCPDGYVMFGINSDGTKTCITDQTGNWSIDKSNYFTSAQILGFNYYNSTNFNLNNYFTKSEILGFSYYNNSNFPYTSLSNFTNDMSFLTSESDPKAYNGTLAFNSSLANYYSISNPFGFYNSTNPSPTYNATYNTWAYNQTIPAINIILGYGYYNLTNFNINDYLLKSSWNATNISYYLASNPFGFYNSTNFNIADYYLKSNPFSFYNSTTLPASTETLWNANYSTFLTHITWANAVNGTLLLTSQWNATNISYYLATNPYSF